MEKCAYCDAEQKQHYPVCHSCGAIRYSLESPEKSASPPEKRFKKLKLSASVAAALLTPGAFIVLAAVGVNHINNKRKNQRKSN